MGCDIHFYVDKKTGGVWKSADTFKKAPNEGRVTQVDGFYDCRNYNLFAILANVRNGRGFAGARTGEGFSPISEPKGLPDDVSKETKQASDDMGGDGHSHSWFTLRELLDYDWTQTTKLQGVVDLPTWAAWSRWERGQGLGPRSYSSSAWGRSGKDISNDDMDKLAETYNQFLRAGNQGGAEAFAESNRAYSLAGWETSYYRVAGDFLGETVPRLLKLAGGVKGVDDVRVVFFFDN